MIAALLLALTVNRHVVTDGTTGLLVCGIAPTTQSLTYASQTGSGGGYSVAYSRKFYPPTAPDCAYIPLYDRKANVDANARYKVKECAACSWVDETGNTTIFGVVP